ncbi:MAG TPA: class I SAM-dependent methyltransferase [Ktedonobacterales bacterium]
MRGKPRTEAALIPADGSPTALMHGRERVIGVPYALPADLEEINRLDFQHYLLRHAFQGNYAAPIANPQSILDVGTGTGRWAIEMAQIFPSANVIGLDVKPPAVDERAQNNQGPDPRPANYAFAPGNVLEGLPFADGTFDFVHQRLLFSAIPHDRWPWVVAELARVTRPGGWVELVETLGFINGGPHIEQIRAWMGQFSARRGVDGRDGSRVEEFLRGAGLSNVVSRRVDLPTGAYGGRIGALLATDCISVFRGYGGIVVAQGYATQEHWDQMLAGVQADLNSPSIKCIIPFFIAYGQRPG